MEKIDKDALIEHLQKEIVALKAEIEQLKRLLGMNLQNSSKHLQQLFLGRMNRLEM